MLGCVIQALGRNFYQFDLQLHPLVHRGKYSQVPLLLIGVNFRETMYSKYRKSRVQVRF
jgi:hypothetical protein